MELGSIQSSGAVLAQAAGNRLEHTDLASSTSGCKIYSKVRKKIAHQAAFGNYNDKP
jgi:hypothetical protein